MVILGPRSKTHFTDQLRPHPNNRLGYLWVRRERTSRCRKRLNPPENLGHGFMIEPGTHVTHIDQFALLIEAEHKRTKIIALTLRIAADHKFLLRHYLDLQPLITAFRIIGAIGALADDPFEPLLAGSLQQFHSLPDKMIRVSHRSRRI